MIQYAQYRISIYLNEANNKLYFQVLEDKDYTYEIQITPGNYTVSSLLVRDEIKSGFESIQRTTFTDNLVIKDGSNALLEKSLNFSAIVMILILSTQSYRTVL